MYLNLTKEKITKLSLTFVITLLCFGVMAIVLFGVKQFKLSSQLAGINQVTNLSHLFVRQQANLFSMLLVNNASPEKLVENLDRFAQEEFVLDASLYNGDGGLLAQSGNALNLREQLGLEQGEVSSNTQQIVEPIYNSQHLVGFLRVTFDAQYGQITGRKVSQLFHKLYAEIILVFLIGLLLASSVHYFLNYCRRSARPIPIKPLQVKRQSFQGSLTFHRRRKRFKY